MKNYDSEFIFNPNISRRKFLSRSVSIAITATCSLNALSVFAKTFNLDEDDLITLFSHEFTGFNGETLDPVTGNYMLGNGYRAYNPTLIRFMSQDSLSPFAEAGINAYQYCSGDPINRSDPSGHLDSLKLGLGILAVLVGIAGVIAAPLTGGSSLAIAGGVIGSAAGAISGGLTIASAVVAEINPDVADKLDIASWAFTGISLVAGLMGHIYLIFSYFKRESKNELNKIYNNAYGLTLMALFFTMFGTILGGIWADQSWGRFWGWDPKENGALLIVLWHLMMLHLRISGMVKPLGYAVGISLVNIIVAIAWFGVNLLNIGLHSYGFTDNVATNLFLFICIELIFILSFYFLNKKKVSLNI